MLLLTQNLPRSTNTWDVATYSVQSITTEGAVRFTMPQLNAGVIAGLNPTANLTLNHPTDFKYGILTTTGNALIIIVDGVFYAVTVEHAIANIYEIEYLGTSVIFKYSIDGIDFTTLYTATAQSAGQTLFFNGLIFTGNAGIFDIQLGHYAVAGNINGTINPSNVYTYLSGAIIDSAFIKNAAIKTAHIDDLQVETIKIKDNAVVVSFGNVYPNDDVVIFKNPTLFSFLTVDEYVLTPGNDFDYDMNCLINFGYGIIAYGPSYLQYIVVLQINGNTEYQNIFAFGLRELVATASGVVKYKFIAGNTYTIRLILQPVYNTSSVSVRARHIIFSGFKK